MYHLTKYNSMLDMIQLRMYGSDNHETHEQTIIIQNSVAKFLTRGQKN